MQRDGAAILFQIPRILHTYTYNIIRRITSIERNESNYTNTNNSIQNYTLYSFFYFFVLRINFNHKKSNSVKACPITNVILLKTTNKLLQIVGEQRYRGSKCLKILSLSRTQLVNKRCTLIPTSTCHYRVTRHFSTPTWLSIPAHLDGRSYVSRF